VGVPVADDGDGAVHAPGGIQAAGGVREPAYDGNASFGSAGGERVGADGGERGGGEGG